MLLNPISFTAGGAATLHTCLDSAQPERDALDRALVGRRAAYAAYGRGILEADYAVPQAERDARREALRAQVRAAEAAVADALLALEAAL